MCTFEPLTPKIEPYLDVSLADLPEEIRVFVEKLPFTLWDHIAPSQRLQYVRDNDFLNDPAYELERTAGWLEAVYDAPTWWAADSVTAQSASMLLAGHNPISETVEVASNSTNDEMGPDDFLRIKFTLEGATSRPDRSLKDWLAYAREKGLKIHPWLGQWEEWVADVDKRNVLSLSSKSTDSLPSVAPVAYQPKLRAQGDLITQCLLSKDYDPKKLPKAKNGLPGVKAEIWAAVQDERRVIPSKRAFDNAWQILRTSGMIQDEP